MQNRETETWSTLLVVDEISQTQVARHVDGSLRMTVTDALLASRMDGETRPEVVIHFSPAALHALAGDWRRPHDGAGDTSSPHPLLTQFRWFLESAAKRHTYVCDYLWLPAADEIKHQDTVHLLFDTPSYMRFKQQAAAVAAELWPAEFRE